MKKIVKVVLVLILGMIIGGVFTKITAPAGKETKEKISVVEVYTCENDGDVITEYSDGSWSCVNSENGVYEFQPIEMGDWSYVVDTKEQLDNLVATYKNIKEIGMY